MDCYVVDENFDKIDIVENIRSLIWTIRYSAYGDFELRISPNNAALQSIKEERYLIISDDDTLMFIEQIEIVRERDDHVILVTGRSFTSILFRRIVTTDYNNPPNSLSLLQAHINAAFITPPNDANKKVPNLTQGWSPTGLPNREAYEYTFKGKNTYEVTKSICDDLNLGFRITTDGAKQHRFQVYQGSDHTITSLQPVVFSNEMGNLVSSRYLSSTKSYYNYAYIDPKPQDSVSTIQQSSIESPHAAGIRRREIYIDGSSLVQAGWTGTQLIQRSWTLGDQTLRYSPRTFIFEAEPETKIGPQFGIDYLLGDTITFNSDIKGLYATYRVIEFVRSYTSAGTTMYPTFAAVT